MDTTEPNREKISKRENILTQLAGKNTSIVWYFTYNLAGEDVSTNPITFIRKDIDILCLPRSESVEKIWKWAQSVFQYTDQQVYFYDKFTNEIEERSLIEHIINFSKSEGRVIKFFPFCTNKVLNTVADFHKVEVLNDNLWTMPDKSWLHKNPSGSNSTTPEEIFKISFPKEVNVPRGFLFHSFEELHEAKRLLTAQGVNQFFVKNVIGLGGDFNWPIRTENEFEVALKEINFPKNILGFTREPTYLIEELIEYEVKESDECFTPIVHYVGDIICPGVYQQYCKQFSYLGMNSLEIPKNIQDECLRQAKIISDTLKFKGPWGIDFVVNKEQTVFLIDINCGRICGSHYFRFFIDLYAPEQAFESWTIYKLGCDIDSFYKKLKEWGLDFNFETRRGVMPKRVNDTNKVCLLCVGDTIEDVQEMKQFLIRNLDLQTNRIITE